MTNKKFTDEQALAVGTTAENVIVTARAGSGKTRVIIARAVFLIRFCNVPASKILILAFNKSAVQELRERVLEELAPKDKQSGISDQLSSMEPGEDGIEDRRTWVKQTSEELKIDLPEVRTFNSLADSIVREPGESLNILQDEYQFINRIVQEYLDAGGDNLIKRVMMDYFREDWTRAQNPNHKEKLLKFIQKIPDVTLANDWRVTPAEKAVCNFLFENSIYPLLPSHGAGPSGQYRLGRSHWAGPNIYKPTLTITGYKAGDITDNPVLLVDFEEDTQGYQKVFNSKENYSVIDLSTAKSNQDKISLLKTELKKRKVKLQRLTDNEIWELIRDRVEREITELLTTFISRSRQQHLSGSDIEAKVKKYDPIVDSETGFLEVASKIFGDFLAKLERDKKFDYSGVIMRAVGNDSRTETYSHVLIDEYQDFGYSFNKLVELVMRNNPDAHVFRVGDDWQAINSFAGSETGYIKDSSPRITKYNLVQNHRSSPEIVEAGNQVMRDTGGKPGQSSGNIPEGTVQVAAVEDYKFSPIEADKYRINNLRRFDIEPMVLRLVCKFLEQDKGVVLLSRTKTPQYVEGGKSLQEFLRGVKSQLPKTVADKKNRVTASTIHSYKGREEDAVIILDCFESRYPLFHPHAKFERIWGVTPDSISEQELNVAYVAVTRAKSELVLITGKDDCPEFLKRIMELPFVKGVDWRWFPAFGQEHEQRVVRIGNYYEDIYSTMLISQALKSSGYGWKKPNPVWKNSWLKVIKVNGQDDDDLIDELKREAWCTKAANDVEVRISNQNEEVLKRFKVVEGVWQELGDLPPQASSNNPGPSWPKPDNSESTEVKELP